MYDYLGRYCPKHPTLVHPCQICATPSSDVSPDAPDNTIVDGVNWQAEAATPYNTPQPPVQKHDSMLGLAERLGLDEHWDDPHEDRHKPPPVLPIKIPGIL